MLFKIGWLLGLTVLQASQAPTGVATDVTNAAMMDVIKEAAGRPTADIQMRVADVGNARVGVAVVRRTGADQNALIHLKVTEVYVIKEGSGTLVTGGTLADAKPPTDLAVVGPTVTGSSIRGGTSRKVVPGDVVIIPPNVPHSFSQLDGPIVYSVIRVDPEKILAVK